MSEFNQEHLNYINTRLKKHYRIAEKEYGKNNVIGAYVFGSWNVGSWIDGSDVDSIVLINSKEAFEKKYVFEDGSEEVSYQISIPKLIFWLLQGKELSQQLLDLLTTPFCLVNVDYNNLNNQLRNTEFVYDLICCFQRKIYNSLLLKVRNDYDYLIEHLIMQNLTEKQYRKALYHLLQSPYYLNSYLYYKNFEESLKQSQCELRFFKENTLNNQEAYLLAKQAYNTILSKLELIKDIDDTKVKEKLEEILKNYLENFND